jgi:flagellin-like hook-associated protein FlgL
MRNQAWAEEAKLTTASKVANDGASMTTAEDARWDEQREGLRRTRVKVVIRVCARD